MEYYGGKEMAASFRTVRGNTLKIAEEIPEDKYDFKPSGDTRTVRQLLTHIALIPTIQTHILTSKITEMKDVPFMQLVGKMTAEESMPRTKAEILALLKSEGDRFASLLESLPESTLAERVAPPPGAPQGPRSRFEMLLSVKEHEMHHRAQLMTMQRMIGLVPHLTRQMMERVAQMHAQARPAGQTH
jgi:uncharacterized damage-inducible protein DinB